MAWLHTWAGLTIGWVIYFMFLTGTAAYFDDEIGRWMQPEIPFVSHIESTSDAVDIALRSLEERAPGAERWYISPSSTVREYQYFLLLWRHYPSKSGTHPPGRIELNAQTGAPLVYRDTGGGILLYRMHYLFHYLPRDPARWVAGLAGMAMFVILITGIVIHRRIFLDFFTFRLGRKQRSWLDAHNVLAVLALPYHLMITYTGLVFIAYLYMVPVIGASYGISANERETFNEDMIEGSNPGIPARSGQAARLAPFKPMIDYVEAHSGVKQIRFIDIRHPGDANARIFIKAGPQVVTDAEDRYLFDGVSGKLLWTEEPRHGLRLAVDTMLSVHEGLFADLPLRWLLFLISLAGTAMVGAGLVLWTVKRRARIGSTFGFRLVEALNIGTVVGLPIAIAAYFWANRLIPAAMEGRAAWEAHAMFIAWAILLLHAFVRPARRAWIEQSWIAAAACLLLPVLNALTTDRHLGVTLPAGDWVLAGFDLTIFAFGLAFAAAALAISRRYRAAEFS
jgi:uncharacterized iron-regulated membrane protein